MVCLDYEPNGMHVAKCSKRITLGWLWTALLHRDSIEVPLQRGGPGDRDHDHPTNDVNRWPSDDRLVGGILVVESMTECERVEEADPTAVTVQLTCPRLKRQDGLFGKAGAYLGVCARVGVFGWVCVCVCVCVLL